MTFDQDEFNRFAVQHGVVKFTREPFTTKGGIQTYWEVSWHDIVSNTKLCQTLVEYVVQFIHDNGMTEPETYLGIPSGARMLGTLTTAHLGKKNGRRYRHAELRSMPKDFGDYRSVLVGGPISSAILIKDVNTTGKTVRQRVEQLQAIGTQVTGAICLTQRMYTEDTETSCIPLTEGADLVALAIQAQKPARQVVRSVTEEFNAYSTDPLDLPPEVIARYGLEDLMVGISQEWDQTQPQL